MGVNGLCQFLKTLAPDLVREIPLSSLAGQRVAVDASVYLYKYICIDNQYKGQWLDMFLNFIVWLRKNNIRPVFIFDGVPPPEKERTQQDRRDNRRKIKETLDVLGDLLDRLEEYNYDENIPEELKRQIDDLVNADTKAWSRKQVLFELNNRYRKENSKCIQIGDRENKKIQDLLTFMGLPWFKATGEAEKTCSWLCKWGYVKGVVTTDSDTLVYGTPIFIQDVRVNKETCNIIQYDDILEVLGLTPEEFKDFCIMCGTDYNKRMTGYGPAKAYKLLCEHNNLDVLSKLDYDTDILHYQDGRRLFTLPDKHEPDQAIQNATGKHFRIPQIQPLNTGPLHMLLFKSNSRFTVEELQEYYYEPRFIVI